MVTNLRGIEDFLYQDIYVTLSTMSNGVPPTRNSLFFTLQGCFFKKKDLKLSSIQSLEKNHPNTSTHSKNQVPRRSQETLFSTSPCLDLKTIIQSPLPLEKADTLVENVVGVAACPIKWQSVKFSNKTLVLPFLQKESPVASTTHTISKNIRTCLKQALLSEVSTPPVMQAQIQLCATHPPFPIDSLKRVLTQQRSALFEVANAVNPSRVRRGGGLQDLYISHEYTHPNGNTAVVILLDIHVCDAMGANYLNEVAEAVGTALTSHLPDTVRVGLQILTNACEKRREQIRLSLPYSETLATLEHQWTQIKEDPQKPWLLACATGLDTVAKVTANDSRAVVSALLYDVYISGKTVFDMIRTETGFDIHVDIPAPFGSVGRLTLFPSAVEALSTMSVGKASDVALHAGVLAVVNVLEHLHMYSQKEAHLSDAIHHEVPVTFAGMLSLANTPFPPKAYEMSVQNRRDVLQRTTHAHLDWTGLDRTSGPSVFLPVGLVPNLQLDGTYLHLLAMTEESSVIAGTCYGIKLISHSLSAEVMDRDGLLTAQLETRIPTSLLGRSKDGVYYPGDAVRDAVIEACSFSEADPLRGITSFKGYLNGACAVAVALGWDDTALAISAYTHVLKDGHYTPIVAWTCAENGDLIGRCDLAMPVSAIQGRAWTSSEIANHLTAYTINTQLIGVAAAGMAVHLASLSALVTHGIQANHMKFHLRSV